MAAARSKGLGVTKGECLRLLEYIGEDSKLYFEAFTEAGTLRIDEDAIETLLQLLKGQARTECIENLCQGGFQVC